MPYFKRDIDDLFLMVASAGPSTKKEEAEYGFIIGMVVEGGCSLSGWQ